MIIISGHSISSFSFVANYRSYTVLAGASVQRGRRVTVCATL